MAWNKSEQNAANIKQNLLVGIAKFSKNVLVFYRIQQKIVKNYEIFLWKLTNFQYSKWY